MKRFSILGICLISAASSFAQMDAVKEADRALKSGNPDHSAIRAQLSQAFTNPESKDAAQTWFIAGKNEFALYDNLFAKKSIGQEVDDKEIGNALLDGYKFFMTALPLDTVVNEKGKVKTKYSKDIVKAITSHYNDFNNAALFLWEAKDFEGAYCAWDIYLSIPNNPAMRKDIVVPHDTIMGELAYNQALAAWQAERLDSALVAFDHARALGYEKKALFDYAISVAAQKMKNDVVYALAADAYKLYGKEDSKYISLVINGYIESKEYDKAHVAIEEALALDPNNGELYDVKGIIYESTKENDKALECYKKATELNPEFARAQYHLGRKMCEKAYSISDGANNLSQDEYLKVRDEQIFPLLREASQYLEKAFELDENQRDALLYLRNVYYNLGDETNLKRIELL